MLKVIPFKAVTWQDKVNYLLEQYGESDYVCNYVLHSDLIFNYLGLALDVSDWKEEVQITLDILKGVRTD